VEFRILGPLEARQGDDVVRVGGARQRALLAILLLHANEVVSVDRLVDELWAEAPPATAAHTVQVHVSNLRKALEAAAPGAAGRLETRPPGYRLRTEPGELDLERFEALCARARAETEPERAAALLADALALWRGAPLADVAYESFAQPAIGRLEELRLAALEERVDADLACGRHTALVGELQPLVAAHPLRERLRGQLMLALYRSGRQAEALDVFQEGRRALVEDLGIEPGPALQRLERAILRQERELELERETPPPQAPPSGSRAVLLAAGDTAALDGLLSVVEPLAGPGQGSDLILARLVARGEELAPWTTLLNDRRSALADRGVSARTAAFTSVDPGHDLVRLASEQAADVLVLDAAAAVAADGSLAADARTALAEATCDVALLFARSVPTAPPGPVLVPFGGSDHDWAALELGAWLAGARGSTLRLLGTEADEEGRRDASRLLAHAALAVQQLAGVPTEPALGERGAGGIVEAAAAAGVLVCGLAESWRQDGLAGARAEAARLAPAPALLVRRGPRPGGLAPRDHLTRYTWSLSLVGTASGEDAARHTASA
jgi:DNA-binding SARP family transcriptional activator